MTPKGRRRRLSSLRSRAYVVVVIVALLPLAFVLAASLYDRLEAIIMAAQTEKAGVALLGGASVETRGVELAKQEGVRIRVVTRDDHLLVDADHDAPLTLRDRVGDLFFGPDGAPDLNMYEGTRPPLRQRPEVLQAFEGPSTSACTHELGGKLIVCHFVAPMAGGDAVVVVQNSSPRAIRAFYDVRYPLLKLTLYVVMVALVSAALLGRRLVAPIEKLRDAVISRSTSGATFEPIAAKPGDEIGDLAESFNALLKSIAERRKDNEAFLADLAHELKSPIAAIRAAAETLADGGPLDEARARRLGNVLSKSGERLDTLVTQFLDLARAEAGLPNEERTELDLAELTHGLVETLKADARFGGVEVRLATEEARIQGALARVEIAIKNLLENAASFAGPGGSVTVTVGTDGDRARVRITDSGPGIAPEHLDKIWSRFFTDRKGSTTAATMRGTGLGLALVKAIAEAHGGSVEVDSKDGAGATFTLNLPAT